MHDLLGLEQVMHHVSCTGRLSWRKEDSRWICDSLKSS